MCRIEVALTRCCGSPESFPVSMEGSTATADRFNQRPTACRRPGRFDAVNAGRFAVMRSIGGRVNRVRLRWFLCCHACQRCTSAIRSKRLDCLYYS